MTRSQTLQTLSSLLTSDPKQDFGVFAKGYTLAAERLARLLLEAPRFSDYEACPVVFLYRQALELYLKHVIYSSAKLAAFKFLDEVDRALQNSHDLKRLSAIVEALLARFFPDDESLRKVTAAVVATCFEFSNIDPRSDAYRYPIDSKGLPSTDRHQEVNLRAFASRMSSVLQDVAAPVIAGPTVFAEGRQMPLPFELRYDPRRIRPDRTYAVRAAIRSAGQMMFTTDAHAGKPVSEEAPSTTSGRHVFHYG